MLSVKARKIIYKFPIFHQLCKEIVNINNKIYFREIDKIYAYKEKIKDYRDSANGKRCFIIGNGPSITIEDLEKLKNEDCFACNLIIEAFKSTNWRPKYYTITDAYAWWDLEKYQLDSIFVSSYYLRKHKKYEKNENIVCFECYSPKRYKELNFSSEISEYVSDGMTVTYANIQLAVYMGYKEIYLIGIDHNYSNIVDDNGRVAKGKVDKDHFYNERKNIVKNLTNIERTTYAYKKAEEYCKENGIIIKNATRGGKLEIFERINFDSLFEDK